MTDLIKIPANSEAYLTAVRDDAADKFDVVEFAYDYLNPAAFPTPWAYWKMEEEGLETRADSSGNNHPLLPYTDVLEPGEDFDRVAGKVGYGMEWVAHYQGALDTYVEEELPLVIGENTPFTLAFWVKPTALGVPDWTSWYLDTYNLWLSIDFRDSATASLSFGISGPFPMGTETIYVESGEILASDAWYFIVLEFTGSGLYLYIDNELINSMMGDDDPNISGSNYLEMGGVYEDEATFAFDEFGIWIGTALSEDQRAYLWNGGAGRSLY